MYASTILAVTEVLKHLYQPSGRIFPNTRRTLKSLLCPRNPLPERSPPSPLLPPTSPATSASPRNPGLCTRLQLPLHKPPRPCRGPAVLLGLLSLHRAPASGLC